VIGAVKADDPEVRVVLVCHDVAKLANVNDAAAIRRNLRISRVLKVEDVDGLKAIRFLFGARRRDK
jgi:hypothetical protein